MPKAPTLTTPADRQPIRAFDPNGTPIVRIPLAKGRGVAVLFAEDFDQLTALGVSPRWCLNADGKRSVSTVRVACAEATGGLLSIGQLIMDAPPGRAVRHVDGNRLNLRRDNLMLVEHARAHGREHAWLMQRRVAVQLAAQRTTPMEGVPA